MTIFNVTGGFILKMAEPNQWPGILQEKEKHIMRELAYRVREIAALPIQQQRRNLWYQHNHLEKTRPLVAIYPEDCWEEVLPAETCIVQDPFFAQWEWYLRHLIYRHEHYVDDFVIEPDLWVQGVVVDTGFGLKATETRGGPKGSYVWDPPIKDPADFKLLKRPEYSLDYALTEARVGAISELLGDILPVHAQYIENIVSCLVGEYTHFRGITQFYLDMVENPELVHRMMDFFAECNVEKYEFLEREGLLQCNNRNQFVDSGGVGYNHELPSQGTGPNGLVLLKDVWGFAVAQEMSEVSPEMHREFLLPYHKRLLDRLGLVSYGCCEPYTHKFDMLREELPKLRRVSVSPWCNVSKASQKLGKDIILSFKPNPAVVINSFSEKNIREYIRPVLETTQDNVVEIIHKDLFSIMHEPERLIVWEHVVRDEIARLYGN